MFLESQSPGTIGPSAQGDAKSDLVQPTGQQAFFVDAAGFARQDEHGRLKSILGLMEIGQDSPAQTPDHRPMPPEQKFESRFVVLKDESVEQLGVGNAVLRGRSDEAP